MPRAPRFQAVNWAFTYPRCPVSPEQAVSELKNSLPPMTYIEVVREKHSSLDAEEDGEVSSEVPGEVSTEFHLHALVIFESRLRTSNARFADLCSHHGDYKPLTTRYDVKRWKAYINKDPVDLAVAGELPEFLKSDGDKGPSKASQVQSAILQGCSVRSLLAREELSGYLVLNLRKVMEFASYVNSGPSGHLPWPALDHSRLEFAQITGWIDRWVVQKASRRLKTPQLWVWGGKNLGKTTLKEQLMRCCSVYVPHLTESSGVAFLDGYEDNLYDLIIFDEFKAQFKLTTMNQLLDGSQVRLHVRGGHVMKRQNLPIIVFSNYSPRQCYPNISDEELDTILSRLTVVEVKSFIKAFVNPPDV